MKRNLRWILGFVGGMAILVANGPAVAEHGANQAQLIMSQSDLTYATSFRWTCSAKTWGHLVDHPLLVAQLWQAYGYAPAYEVHSSGDTIHVDDPTGLAGKVLTIGKTPTKQTYLILGRLDHWAVPFFNQGMAVFELNSRFEEEKVSGDLTVYIKANSMAAGMVLEVGRPLLSAHVENRIKLNLQDLGKIVEAVETQPEVVAAKLNGALGEQFVQLFCPEPMGCVSFGGSNATVPSLVEGSP